MEIPISELALKTVETLSDNLNNSNSIQNNSINSLSNTNNSYLDLLTGKELPDDLFNKLSSQNPLNNNYCLSDEERTRIKTETGWSDEIINNINSIEEYEIYKKAGLVECEINGRKCLIRTDIDWNQKDQLGRTNLERVKQGLAPLDKNGRPIELHHIGKHNNSPLAELTQDEHRSSTNYPILHGENTSSEINRKEFDSIRAEHWKNRSEVQNV